MTSTTWSPHARAGGLVVAALLLALLVGTTPPPVAAQESYQRISGEGSSWAANAIDAMRVNVRQFGITVDYNPSGSTSGRKNFLNGTVDFAASDIPFQFEPEDGSAPENPAPDSYAYIPVTAGGTAFMYNLRINGQQVTNLRLSGENVAKIFTLSITKWNDPALQADNPGIVLPDRDIVPVVRSDGSGSTAQFTQWMIAKHGGIWNDYCGRSGRAPACGFTSQYPVLTPSKMLAQAGDTGIAGYVSQGFAEGAIGYVNYSYALGVQFPVAKVLNSAGFYTEPTPNNVAVSLLQARINEDASNPAVYLTQQLDGVYNDTDPRNYQLSSYSYFILPTRVGGQFNEAKGRTLGEFAYYAMCQAQQSSASLGYSPMPFNLVEASFNQIRKIPGVVEKNLSNGDCKNPTFSPDGTNVLANEAPQPQECDRQGPVQCATGTGGLSNVPTATAAGPVVVVAGGGGTSTGGGGGEATASGTPAAGGAAAGGEAGAGGSTAGATTGGGAAAGGAGGAATGATGGTTAGTATAAGGATATGEPGVAGDPADPNGTGVALACDADTGECAPAAAGGAAIAQSGTGGSVAGATVPVTLDQAAGWGATQTLMLVVALLTLALVLVPAAAWRHLSRRSPA